MNKQPVDTSAQPTATSTKDALKVVADISSQAKEASQKRDANKKNQAYNIITTMRGVGKSETEVLKALQSELGLTYPNAYYYTKRVFTK